MTKTRYLIVAAVQKFGLIRKTKRLTDAAFEMHLMQDGEEILGAYCWQNLGEMEDLSLEYWNLRRLDRKKTELLEKIQEAEAQMGEAQQKKVEIALSGRGDNGISIRERDGLIESLKSLQNEYDRTMSGALATKKRHQALKMKLKVLKGESGQEEEIKGCLAGLAEFRNIFLEEKNTLDSIKKNINTCQNALWKIEEKIGEDVRGTEGETNQAYVSISKANRDITNFKAELASVVEEQCELFREVGHFLNLNHKRNDCQKACKKHRIFLTQVRLLLISIKLNRQLVESVRINRKTKNSLSRG